MVEPQALFSQGFIFSGPKIGPYGQCVIISGASFLDCISDLEFIVVTLSIPRMFMSEGKMVKVT